MLKFIKNHGILSLALANAVALALLLGANDAAAFGGGDYCTGSMDGCDCYSGPWSPDGCYDSASVDGGCSSGSDCE
jgi:uncharacterized membrane protein